MDTGQIIGGAVGIATLWALLRESKKTGVRIDVLGQVNDPVKGVGVRYAFVTPEFTTTGIKYFSDTSLTFQENGKYDLYVDNVGDMIYLAVKLSSNDKTLAELNINKTTAIGAANGYNGEGGWDYRSRTLSNRGLFTARFVDAQDKCIDRCIRTSNSGPQLNACLKGCEGLTRERFTRTQLPGWKFPIYRIK